MSSIADFLGGLQREGFLLWLDNGRLRYKAARGALSSQELERLRTCKDQIVAFLEREDDAQYAHSSVERRPRLSKAPLAFSQLAHWQVHRLGERPTSRNVASATRLLGQLSVAALETSLAEVVRRHDALRTRIVVEDGAPIQKIDAHWKGPLQFVDLTALPGPSRATDIADQIESFVLEPIDVAADPLFAARLIRLTETEFVLILALEHIVSDAVTLDILLREILTAYASAAQGRPLSLPPIPFQFTEYATWKRHAHSAWLARHGPYWEEHLRGCGRVRFPDGTRQSTEAIPGWSHIEIRIGSPLRRQLVEWCRQGQTSLSMSVFTAYAAFVLRWCEVTRAVIRYQSDGRAGPGLQHTPGFFASRLYLRVELLGNDTFLTLLRRVTQEYCNASEHDDSSYLETQDSPPACSRNTFFNWIPQGGGSGSHNKIENNGIETSRIHFVNPWFKNLEWDNEPMTMLHDTGDEITGGVYFSSQRLSIATMQRFTDHFLTFLERMLRAPEKRIADF